MIEGKGTLLITEKLMSKVTTGRCNAWLHVMTQVGFSEGFSLQIRL